jgi:hypothetical protein
MVGEQEVGGLKVERHGLPDSFFLVTPCNENIPDQLLFVWLPVSCAFILTSLGPLLVVTDNQLIPIMNSSGVSPFARSFDDTRLDGREQTVCND